MIRFNDLKQGDLVIAEYEGKEWEGEVVELNREDKEVCIRTDVQDFWFNTPNLKGIPLNDHQLKRLGFEKQSDGTGPVKYLKGAFRILLLEPDRFDNFEMWYREDRRHIAEPIYVHELQNHYRAMTKVELSAESSH
ncbi:MAG TPA: hypothetical protein VGD17_19825 [Chitinophagaceae bacterium]